MLKQRADGAWTWQYDHAGIAEARLNPDPSRQVDLWPHVETIKSPTLVLRGGRSDYLARDVGESLSARNRNIQCKRSRTPATTSTMISPDSSRVASFRS
jgi:esterase